MEVKETLLPKMNQDSAWKDIIELYFPEFIEFFYPKVFEKIDWTKRYESLDKKLEKITTDSMIGKRYVDKLMDYRHHEKQLLETKNPLE